MLALALTAGWGLWVFVFAMHVSRARRMWLTLVVLSAMLLPGTWIEVRWRLNEHAIEEAVRTLIGRDDVEVYCQRFTDDLVDTSRVLGYVPLGEAGQLPTAAYLRRETCNALSEFRDDPVASNDAVGWMAVHVLTHEAMHLAGIENEAQAECAAQQRDAAMAQLLGADAPTGQQVATGYATSGYPRLPADYRSTECVDGGAWDEDLDFPPWPDKIKARGYSAPLLR